MLIKINYPSCEYYVNTICLNEFLRSLLLLGKYMFGDIDDSVTMLGTEEEVATEVLAVLKVRIWVMSDIDTRV